MDASPLERLKFALSAYNRANKQSNRMWIAAAALSALTVSAATGSKIESVFNANFDLDNINNLLLMALSVTNISYCTSHVNVFRIAAVYQSIIKSNLSSEKKIAGEFTWYDLAQRAPASTYNRIYPLLRPIEKNLGKGTYILIKYTIDFIYCFLPASAIVFGIIAFYNPSILYYTTIIVASFSVLCNLFLSRWILKWPKYAARRDNN